ncbi:glycosyltransferase family 61 protein [Calothrix membranacea FACHB-236]|nr:glycosyltransferase family 61 protein [Calothrix membranacea FACHB-236]
MRNYIEYKICQASEEIQRITPNSIDDNNIPDIFQREAKLYNKTPESGIYIIKNGTALALGDCYTQWGNCVHWNNESLPINTPRPHKCWSVKPWVIPKKRFSGTVAVLTHPQQHGYFHWLFDVLPRLALLEKVGLQPDYLYIAQSLPFQRDSLALLGYKYPIIDATETLALCADYLFIPSAASVSGVMSPWICNFLHQRLGQGSKSILPSSEKIYVSRQKTKYGKLINEQIIKSFLETKKFQTVYAEDISLPEQIGLFRHAKIVIGPHGAGLSNFVFTQPNAQLIELLSPDYLNLCYWTLAGQIQANYSFILGEKNMLPVSTRPNIDIKISQLKLIINT